MPHSWARAQAGDHRGALLGCDHRGASLASQGSPPPQGDFLWLVDAECLPKPVCNVEKNISSACLPQTRPGGDAIDHSLLATNPACVLFLSEVHIKQLWSFLCAMP